MLHLHKSVSQVANFAVARKGQLGFKTMQRLNARKVAPNYQEYESFRNSASTAVAEPVPGNRLKGNLSNAEQDQHSYKKVLVRDGGICPKVETIEYAVRGELVLRAQELSSILEHQKKVSPNKNGPVKGSTNSTKNKKDGRCTESASELPFDKIIYCNIGNPQSVGQSPVTFIRQVLAAIMCPDFILHNPEVSAHLPEDVRDRANLILSSSHGMGAYSESKGLKIIRERVADSLARRDQGVSADPDNLFLTNGASEAVKVLMQLLIRSPSDGILIPIPQYPLYSATLQALGGRQVGYYLDEQNGWCLSISELERRLNDAKADGTDVRALCVINPGNPTGSTLSRENMTEIVKFCAKNSLVLMADEVYQNNTYIPELPFVSFKRVVVETGSPVELASFHSVSKGVLGECGLRGGYMELHNMDEHAVNMVYKCLSISLCSNIPGQVAVDVMMNPPQPGDPSHERFERETQSTFHELRRKSQKLESAFNTFEGVTCNAAQGAMYLFPQIKMPLGALKKSKEQKLKSPDMLYCRELLEETGICVVPGSGFGQQAGTFHFRTTFLPPENQVDEVIDKMHKFHRNFMARYSS